MSLTNPNKAVTEQRLAEFYQEIYPYLGGMPEMLANKFDKGNLYSTDEKMIGQWIDGKPLYQKVIDTSSISPTTSGTLIFSGVDTIVDYKFKRSNNKYVILFDGPSTSSQLALALNNGNVYLEAWASAYNFNNPDWVILQYTKTTDSAISIGVDTDYSTTEKIVGTWIDGEPIYQKVVPVDISLSWNGSYYAHADVSPLINNVDRIIYSYAYSDQLSACCSIAIYNDHWNIIVSEREGNLKYVFIQYTKTTD